MLRTNRETFPDELTGPHVEHLTGLRLALGQSAEEVKARENKTKTQAKQVREIKIVRKEETKQHPVLMCHARVRRAYVSVRVCVSVCLSVCASPESRLCRSPFHLI